MAHVGEAVALDALDQQGLEALCTNNTTALRQLRCAGVVAALEMSREKFSTKMKFDDLDNLTRVVIKMRLDEIDLIMKQ